MLDDYTLDVFDLFGVEYEPAAPTTKTCRKCGEDKPLSEYSRDCKRKDGLRIYCKACQKAYREANKEKAAAYAAAYYKANKAKVAARERVYREANKEKKAARGKAYYEANKAKILARCRAYREANREECAARRKAHYEANREQHLARGKAYREANRDEIAARAAEWYKANREKVAAWSAAYYEENREKVATREKAYREANKERLAAHAAEWYEANRDTLLAKAEAKRHPRVYRIDFEDGCYYYGKSTRPDLRFNQHRREAEKGVNSSALNEQDWSTATWRVLVECDTDDEAFGIESEIIEEHMSDPNCLNVSAKVKRSRLWYVYVIQSADTRVSKKTGKTLMGPRYVGATVDPARRLRQHNREIKGGAKATSKHQNWQARALFGPYHSQREALRAEYTLKRKRGEARLRWSPEDSPLCRGEGVDHPWVSDPVGWRPPKA
jgi:predicted GIY-YIG superfamily endonuclease